MYNTPIRGKGVNESDYMHKVKQAWLQIHFLDDFKAITKKEFFKNFLDILEKYDIPWDCKDKEGNLKYPTEEDYDYCRKNCFSKYKWNECYDQYEFDNMDESIKRAKKLYNKRILKKTIRNEKQIDRINDNIDKLLSEQEDQELHHEYRIAKDVETKNNLDDNSRKLLGLDKEAEDKTPEVIPVSDNPEHELEAINDKWDELMWKEIGEDRPW